MDVIAVDGRGRAVDTLNASDFELRENGEPQVLDEVAFITPVATGDRRPLSNADDGSEAWREGTRILAFFLDEYHVSTEQTVAVRQALGSLVDSLDARDLVAIMKPLDSILAIRLTRDRIAIRQAIETFRGRKGDYTPRSAFEQGSVAGTPARIERLRAQIVTSGLHALTTRLGGLARGRKTLGLVSEGFNQPAPEPGAESLPRLETVVRSANRSNVSIYALDPSVASDDRGTGNADDVKASMRRLADETDGRAVFGPTAMDAALDDLMRDASAYYLLSYRSAHDDDGRFRKIEVRVKRPAVVVRARKGYWALFPDEALAARLLTEGLPLPPKVPSGLAEPLHTSPLVRSWMGLRRGEAGRTRVTFVWEPAPRAPGDPRRQREPAQVTLRAIGGDGSTLFEGPVRSAATPYDSREQVRNAAVFDVPPGRLRLRMAIEDDAATFMDVDIREIAIRDFSSTVAIGTPAVLRARSAVQVRSLAADWQAAPVVTRAFFRSEHLIVRVGVYAEDGLPLVTARLLNRLGQPMRSLDVRPAAGDTTHQIDLPLSSLAPGDYVIEWSASGATAQATETVAFRVLG